MQPIFMRLHPSLPKMHFISSIFLINLLVHLDGLIHLDGFISPSISLRPQTNTTSASAPLRGSFRAFGPQGEVLLDGLKFIKLSLGLWKTLWRVSSKNQYHKIQNKSYSSILTKAVFWEDKKIFSGFQSSAMWPQQFMSWFGHRGCLAGHQTTWVDLPCCYWLNLKLQVDFTLLAIHTKLYILGLRTLC